MLPARILTAAVLLGAFLAVLFLLERWQFALAIGLVVSIAAHEWAGLCGIGGATRLAYAVGAALLYASGALAWFWGTSLTAVFATASAFWLLFTPCWLRTGLSAGARRWLPPIGLLVIVPAALAMLALSPGQLLAAIALPWIADTAAYFAGRAWGRRKLAPHISPGKTLEGAAGGLAAVAIYAIICPAFLPELQTLAHGMAWAALLGGALVLGVLSIVGDLFESAIKRQAGAKDSGSILPGHGGVLDRIDSATSTLPLAALLFQWIRLT